MKNINPNFVRSFLFTPAVKEGFYEKILSLSGSDKPDAIIFDLEDSVAPDKKEEARETLLYKLYEDKEFAQQMFDKYVILIRLNKYGTKWFDEDLAAVKKIKPDFVRLAKVETGTEIRYIRRVTDNSPIAVCIESLRGITNLEMILNAMRPGDVFNIGFEDISAELMMERPERLDVPNPLTTIFLQCLIAARRHRITMIDSVSRKFKTAENLADFAHECAYTRSMGLTGKTAIHPSQVAIINTSFDRTAEIQAAKDNLAQFNALSDGSFVTVSDNYQMKDMPSFKMYNNLLDSLN